METGPMSPISVRGNRCDTVSHCVTFVTKMRHVLFEVPNLEELVTKTHRSSLNR